MIKAIFFDAAGILYTRSGHTEEFALNLLQKSGFPTEISSDKLEEQLALRSQANEGTVSHDIYWDKFLLLRNVIDNEQRVEFARQIINYSNDIQPVPGAREALSQLKGTRPCPGHYYRYDVPDRMENSPAGKSWCCRIHRSCSMLHGYWSP